MSDDWRAAVDDLDRELVAVQDTACGAFWPATAVALALIEAGTLRKTQVLEIIDDLHDLATLYAAPEPAGDATWLLEEMRDFLEGRDWSAGRVRELLQTEASRAALIDRMRRRRRGEG